MRPGGASCATTGRLPPAASQVLIIGTTNTNSRQRPVVALPRFCLRAQRAQACPQLASSGRKPADPMVGSSRGGRKHNTVPTCAGAVRPLAAFAGPSRRGAAAAADAPDASASGGLPPARTSSAQRPDACRPRQAATLDNFPAEHSLARTAVLQPPWAQQHRRACHAHYLKHRVRS